MADPKKKQLKKTFGRKFKDKDRVGMTPGYYGVTEYPVNGYNPDTKSFRNNPAAAEMVAKRSKPLTPEVVNHFVDSAYATRRAMNN